MSWLLDVNLILASRWTTHSKHRAAKLWVDFILSEAGQNVLVKGEAMVSGRAGFKSPLPEYAPAIDTLNVIKVDWEKLSTAELEKLRAEWSSVFNP